MTTLSFCRPSATGQPSDPRHREHAEQPRWWWPALLAILVGGALVRLLWLGSRPGWEWDEPVYTAIGRSVSEGLGLHLYSEIGRPEEPYLYHPPFYFLTLSLWFKVFGASILSARVLSSLCAVLYTLLAAVALRRLISPRAGLLAAALLSFDAWLIYLNRISWIDNSMMVFFVAVILAFAWAYDSDRDWHWALVGLAVGATAVWKHMGIAALPGVTAAVFILRHRIDRPIRRLATVVAVTAAVVGLYLIVMTILYPEDYWRENAAQWTRSSGQVAANGSIDLFSTVWLRGIVDSYWPFLASVLAVVGVSVYGLVDAIRGKARAGTDAHLSLWGFGVGSAAFLAVLALKFPHYLIMVWVPMLCYFAALLDRHGQPRRLLAGALAALLVLNLTGLSIRLFSKDDSALRDAASYLRARLSPEDTLIADEPVGALSMRSSCRGRNIAECGRDWDWIVTYTSLTQVLPDSTEFREQLATATRCASFNGYKETVTVYAREAADCLPETG